MLTFVCILECGILILTFMMRVWRPASVVMQESSAGLFGFLFVLVRLGCLLVCYGCSAGCKVV